MPKEINNTPEETLDFQLFREALDQIDKNLRKPRRGPKRPNAPAGAVVTPEPEKAESLKK